MQRLLGALGMCVEAMAKMIADETHSFAGRLNLASTVIVSIMAVMTLIPSAWKFVLRVTLGQPMPEWTYALPVLGFLGVVVTAIVSLFIIPKEPPE